ncbi:MAG: hypothetical protein M3O91_07475 [Chloroflexota bacterium]|nr:hypothetical protein [Chloroflexota bacterium]
MANNVAKFGHEATHGTIATTMLDFNANFKAKMDQTQYVPKENRNNQDEGFIAFAGFQHEQWEAGGGVYHDQIGYIMGMAMGAPTKVVVGGETVVWDSTFIPADDPWSCSLQWQQTVDYVQGFQSLYGVLSDFEINFGAGNELDWTAKGVAMPETTISQFTPAVAATKPHVAWQGAVTLGGGAFGSLVNCKIGWKRNRAPFWVVNNTQAPKRMRKGMRGGNLEIIVDSDAAGLARYTAWKASTKEVLSVVFVDTSTTLGTSANPQFTISLPNIVWKAAEIDVGGDLPLIKLTADKILYDQTAGAAIKAIVRSNKDWTTI